MTTQNETHFFASCVFGWATSEESRDDAIERLVNAFRHDIKRTLANCLKNGDVGFYLWTCEVLAPADAPYKIEWYAPQGVEITGTEEYAVTYVTQKKAAWGRTYEGEAKAYKAKLDELTEAIKTNANADENTDWPAEMAALLEMAS